MDSARMAEVARQDKCPLCGNQLLVQESTHVFVVVESCVCQGCGFSFYEVCRWRQKPPHFEESELDLAREAEKYITKLKNLARTGLQAQAKLDLMAEEFKPIKPDRSKPEG